MRKQKTIPTVSDPNSKEKTAGAKTGSVLESSALFVRRRSGQKQKIHKHLVISSWRNFNPTAILELFSTRLHPW